jgi:1,4-alpha-glucan branching enzyme
MAEVRDEDIITDEVITQLHGGFCPTIADVMGCHCVSLGGAYGLRFAVWAPNAQYVSVVGDFNGWDRGSHAMRRRVMGGGFTGIWVHFVPFGPTREEVPFGKLYGFNIKGCDGSEKVKIDPFGQEFQCPPLHATVISGQDDLFRAEPYAWGDAAWIKQRESLAVDDNLRRQPMAIYEVHLPSWRRTMEGECLNYRDVVGPLIEHVKALHFNYIELLPLAHHPFDGSWGYQVTGHYGVYSKLGSPDDFKFFMDSMHQAGIGVIMDYVPAHFCKDEWALVNYDGGPTFEYEDPRLGEHEEWGTKVFNFKKSEVRAYLLGAPLFWIERYHIDGIRVDAVSAMLYRNFMRKDGDWIPNENGGDSNLEAVSLLRELNRQVKKLHPGIIMCAEESTSWSGVTQSLEEPSGLGFDFKWDLGWMNDTLSYLAAPSGEKPGKHDKLTFRGLYMQHEKWILPLSHDEVVSGKGSLVDKMNYLDYPPFFDKLRQLRTLIGFQVGSPGRPLLFMGGEIAQGKEWNYRQSVDWHEGEEEGRGKFCTWVSDLMGVYQSHKPCHAGDDEPHGAEVVGIDRTFEWTEVENKEDCLVAFMRHWAKEQPLLFVCNFSNKQFSNYAMGVPVGGTWKVMLNSDDWRYGGTGYGPGNNTEKEASIGGRWGWPACLWLDIPAQSCMVFLAPEDSKTFGARLDAEQKAAEKAAKAAEAPEKPAA